MKEAEKINPADKSLSHAERLEGLLYLYNQLHVSLLEDKAQLLKNITQHVGMLEDFKNQINHFEQLEAGVKNRVVKSIENALADLLSTMDKKISETATERVDKVVKALEKVAQDSILIFETYYRESNWQFWKVASVAVIVAIVSSTLSVHLTLRHLDVRLPEEQMTTYQAGQFAQMLWPKLSKYEQKRLMDIESGKVKDNTEKPHHHRHENPAHNHGGEEEGVDNNDTVN